jgi:membrane associated rhomboid family serine protease
MLSDRSYMRTTEAAPRLPAWKILVGLAILLFLANKLLATWLPLSDSLLSADRAGPLSSANGMEIKEAFLLSFQLPYMEGLNEGRWWTPLFYGLVETNWLFGPLGILLLGVFGSMVEAELSRRQFVLLCFCSALAGAAVWLPLHWHTDELLASGCTTLVAGLLTFWCFTVNEEPLPLRRYLPVPLVARPQIIFWIVLALEFAAFLSLELPAALQTANPPPGHYFNSAHLGAMFAGWAFAMIQRRALAARNWLEESAESTPRRWLQKAMKVGAGREEHGAGTPAAPADAPASGVQFSSRRELREELDRILDKINTGGLGALSPAERQTLDRAKDLLKK